MTTIKEIEQKLKAPFPEDVIQFRVVRVIKDIGQALVLPYISFSSVMDRLDEVLGSENWSNHYIMNSEGVICKLSLFIGEKTITRQGIVPFKDFMNINNAETLAFVNAAAKFGLGRQLVDEPEYFVALSEKKPEKSHRQVHAVSIDKFTGWWKEPELNQFTPETEEAVTKNESDMDFNKLDITQKLKTLSELGIITEKKSEDYNRKIQDKATAPGLLLYFEKQLELLYNLNELAISHKISSDHRATLYRRIMSSKLNGFPALADELKNLKEAA